MCSLSQRFGVVIGAFGYGMSGVSVVISQSCVRRKYSTNIAT